MSRPPSPYAHGFATLITVAMLIFVSMAVMTMTRLTALDTRRTQEAKAQAQQRQLLLAGAAAAVETLKGQPDFTGTTSLHLPDHLDQAEVSFTVPASDSERHRTVHVRVVDDGQTLQQALRLVPAGDGWAPASVAIDAFR